MSKSLRFMGAIAVAGLVAAGGSAFTAANTVAANSAGAGSVAVTVYSTSNIQYGKNATDPQILDSVSVTLNHAATYLAIRTHSGGTWYTNGDLRLTTGTVNSCTSATGAGIVWTCDVTANSETIGGLGTLDVVATA